MTVTEAINNRKSIRYFDNTREVPKEVIIDLLEKASRAASWTNSQPWEAYILTGETLKKLNEILVEEFKDGVPPYHTDIHCPTREEWSEAPRCVENMNHWFDTHYSKIAEAANVPVEEVGKMELDSGCNSFYAPAVLVLGLHKSLTPYSYLDLGSFSATFMLAAQEAGIETIPASIFVYFGKRLREVADIPEDTVAVYGIGFGYADRNHPFNQPYTDRNPVEQFTKFFD